MRALLVIALALSLVIPCAAVDTDALRYALPEEAAEILREVQPGTADAQSGFSALLQVAFVRLRQGMKASVKELVPTYTIDKRDSIAEALKLTEETSQKQALKKA